VMMAIYSSWTAILRSSKVGLDAAAEGQRTRMAMRALQEALGSAELFTANIRHYAFVADTSGNFAGISFVARLPASFPGSGLFGDQTVRRVTFAVERGPNSLNQLVLRQSPLLEPIEGAARPYSIVLAPNVRVFQLEFLDTNTFEWLPEWVSTNQLPKVVKIAANFGLGRGAVRQDDVQIQTVALTAVAIPPLGRRGGVSPLPLPGGPGRGSPIPGGPAPGGIQGFVPPTGSQRDFMYRGGVPPTVPQAGNRR
jgi:hypothetical protein